MTAGTDRFAPDHDWDVAIVGGGPAGLACALTLGRAGRRVALFDDDRPRNYPVRHSQGLLTRDGASPSELRALGREEVLRYGVHVREASVAVVERIDDGEGFRLTVGGDTLTARFLVLASGVEDVLPEIDGMDACWGVTAIHCPYCHGHEWRDRPTVVFGGALALARLLKGWSDDVTYVAAHGALSDPDRAEADDGGVRVVEGEVARLVHTGGVVEAVELSDGTRLDAGVVYLQPPQRQRAPFAEQLGAPIQDGAACIVADDDGRVALAGVFVCGDASSGPQSIASSIDEGARVGKAVNHELIVCRPASAL